MVFLMFTAWLILSQVMISLVQAFFASAGYGFLAGITYAAQAGAHVVFIWIFRSHLPHAAGKKEAGLRNGLQMVLFSAMTGIGLCMAHRVLFFLFPQIAQSTLGQMTAEEQSRILNSARTPAYFLYVGLIGPVLESWYFAESCLTAVAENMEGGIRCLLRPSCSLFSTAILCSLSVQYVWGWFSAHSSP